MTNFFEIDFLDVESPKSGDAVTIRYCINGNSTIHVVDGGYGDTGDKIVDYINKHYDSPVYVDRVVVTHPDGDHAAGLKTVLEKFTVGELWMLRPWLYADELIDRFSRFTSVENLKARLKELYPNLAALEEIADEQGIAISEPFQGAKIGEFTVLAPSKARYLDLIVDSERTPEAVQESSALDELFKGILDVAKKVVAFVKGAWGDEIFSSNETSAENEMSVVQYAILHGHRILLTGDVGRGGLTEAADFAPMAGFAIPGVDRFQVPHHGSRRNVSTEVLDRWLGKRLAQMPEKGKELFTAIISAAKMDEHHPRNSVVRAMIHRGGKVITTEDGDKRTGHNAPKREGWIAVEPLAYPEEQEDA
ncbi:ComEC/Rec2 family competence protein [Paraburkholderia sp. 22099]|uniref:ComEC/Rec2 family competence protein n=1 Tax=Paraburkholderia TaxID=1822464 RepID=UPI00285CA569|nr:MBL fold metallo-hydrolase [Paraburkholderia terricola]MDR6496381.1 beta-lactamase superfamily II metal-dependent hydrolase [Paraburkholderia terricola]